MKRLGFVLGVLLLAGLCLAAFPVVDQGDVQPNDDRLKGPIDESKQGELTIASFNVRNLGNMRRGIKDFAVLAGLVDEADGGRRPKAIWEMSVKWIKSQEIALRLFAHAKQGTQVNEEKNSCEA